jgi:hypothetical protein
MNFRLNRAALCALLLIAHNHITVAVTLVQGNAAGTATQNTATFLSPVIAKLFDHPTATFIASTSQLGGGTLNPDALATAMGTFGADTPAFKALGVSFAEAQTSTMLALATSYGNTSPNIAFVMSSSSPTISPYTTTPTNIVNIVSLNGATSTQSSPLLDASNAGMINVNGDKTSQITSIAANEAFIFAAVNQGSPAAPFGTGNSGIAVVDISPSTLVLNQVPAVPGDGGIKSLPFNSSLPEIVETGMVNINPNQLPNSTQLTYPAMIWDDLLQRLYIGFDLQTDVTSAVPNSGGRSVVLAYLSNPPAGTLELQAIAPNSAFIPDYFYSIVGVSFNEFCYPPYCFDIPTAPYIECNYPPCPQVNLSVHRLAVLHASTGSSYLIVNGGNGLRADTGNEIYALPLVDVDDPTNPIQGTLANVNDSPVNGKFITPAIGHNDLYNIGSPQAVVGAGPFPIESYEAAISDMVVVGDTVYASSSEPLSSVSETGIFYSQALFDETGRIIRWTPWTKRAYPYIGFPDGSTPVDFFDVDASTGELWAVGGSNATAVCVNAWDKGTSSVSLVAQLNQKLSSNSCSKTCYNGCFSVLDLDQSTNGFNGNTCSRYALFGGINKVIFAQISQGFSPSCDTIDNPQPVNPQTVITDFSQPENLLVSSLLECGAVTVLEYSRRGDAYAKADLGNYFYAGTQNGLYVFADPAGNALDVADFGDLDVPPFSNGMWFKAPGINGAVIDIKTTGNTLYVMTVNSTPAAPLQGTVYRIPFMSNVNTMFDSSNLITIAQTVSSAPFNNVLRFSGMQIISTMFDGSTEQLVLTTNRGLFQSARTGGVQDAVSQADASWQLVQNSGTNFYLGVGGMNTSTSAAAPSTVWPFNLQDPLSLKLFNRGSIYQLNGSLDAVPFAFVPAFFNSIDSSNPNFATLDPITYFWSDGARRFFVINPSNKGCSVPSNNNLMVLPFDTIDWNIAKPTQDLSFDPTLTTVQSFNWIQDIGASGITMAGTNQGVVGLE